MPQIAHGILTYYEDLVLKTLVDQLGHRKSAFVQIHFGGCKVFYREYNFIMPLLKGYNQKLLFAAVRALERDMLLVRDPRSALIHNGVTFKYNLMLPVQIPLRIAYIKGTKSKK